MKIIYTGIRKDVYDEKRKGFSFEYNNFYLTLKGMEGVEVIEYPFDRILEVGARKFNADLLDLVTREKPDALFAFMYTEELHPDVLDEIKNVG